MSALIEGSRWGARQLYVGYFRREVKGRLLMFVESPVPGSDQEKTCKYLTISHLPACYIGRLLTFISTC